jgi:signal recognition particle subunit SRP54
MDEGLAVETEERLRSGSFTLGDFLMQLRQVRKMGSLKELMAMIPGVKGLPKDAEIDEGALTRTEAIIQSMTTRERTKPSTINGSRRARIAAGAGVTVFDVNQLLKQFSQAQKMMKQLQGMNTKGGKRRRTPQFPGMGSPFGM